MPEGICGAAVTFRARAAKPHSGEQLTMKTSFALFFAAVALIAAPAFAQDKMTQDKMDKMDKSTKSTKKSKKTDKMKSTDKMGKMTSKM